MDDDDTGGRDQFKQKIFLVFSSSAKRFYASAPFFPRMDQKILKVKRKIAIH